MGWPIFHRYDITRRSFSWHDCRRRPKFGSTMTAPTIAGPQRRPHDEEIDVYGITHTAKARQENQDPFLMMVADGVGGGAKGEVASRMAVEAATQYVQRSMRCYYAASSEDYDEFFEALREAALGCHGELVRR